jgi:hypothetical protein
MLHRAPHTLAAWPKLTCHHQTLTLSSLTSPTNSTKGSHPGTQAAAAAPTHRSAPRLRTTTVAPHHPPRDASTKQPSRLVYSGASERSCGGTVGAGGSAAGIPAGGSVVGVPAGGSAAGGGWGDEVTCGDWCTGEQVRSCVLRRPSAGVPATVGGCCGGWCSRICGWGSGVIYDGRCIGGQAGGARRAAETSGRSVTAIVLTSVLFGFYRKSNRKNRNRTRRFLVFLGIDRLLYV